MSNNTTGDPLFDNAPGGTNDPIPNPESSISTKSEQKRLEEIKKILPELTKKFEEGKSRVDRFLPYLLVRSIVGDRGNRPLNVPFWESPDIWTAVGDHPQILAVLLWQTHLILCMLTFGI